MRIRTCRLKRCWRSYSRSADLSYSPLFQVMFILQNAPVRNLELSGLKLNSVDDNVGTTKFDLFCRWLKEDNTLKAALEYNTESIRLAQTIAQLLRHFQQLLESAVSDPPHLRVPLLSSRGAPTDCCMNGMRPPSTFPTATSVCIESSRNRPRARPTRWPWSSKEQFTSVRRIQRACESVSSLSTALWRGPEVPVGIS